MLGTIALPLVVACGLLAAGGIAALALLRRKETRGGLLPAALALAFVTPSCSVGLTSYPLIQAFSGMALQGGGGQDAIRPALLQANTSLLAGVSGMLLTLGVALIILVASLAAGTDDVPPASPRRLAFLSALAMASLGIALPFFEHARQNVEIVRLVVFADAGTPEAARAKEKYPVLGEGIAEISIRIGRGFTLGTLGGGYVVLVLLGLVAVGALVSGVGRVGHAFAVVGMLLVLATAALGVFWLGRLILELRALSSA